MSIIISALIVLGYTYLGGLKSAIYNEVLQFFLIVIGFLPLVFLGLHQVGGWEGMVSRLEAVSSARGYASGAMTTTWQYTGSASANPMGVEWFGIAMGLGFVLSFGYWCTNFLVVQRAMAADSMTAARKTPLIGALPKMFIPFLVIVPGMIAMALLSDPGSGFVIPAKNGSYDYDKVIPLMLGYYLPNGVLGMGITALVASFMSGMAGNVTAFNAVWTYDIYQSHIKPNQSDRHYLNVGKVATVAGILISIGAAYVAALFNNVMDLLQLIFAFINAPLFATFLLGMFWKRATGHGAFYGLISGTFAATLHHGFTVPFGAASLIKGGWLGAVLHTYPSEMAQNFWTAIFAWTTAFVMTIVISYLTKPSRSMEELKGLVYSLTPRIREEHVKWYARPASLAILVGLMTLVLSILFW